jgi:hypothetical protein
MLQPDSRPLALRLFPVFAVCGLAAVLYLPYQFTMSPSVSFSYLFGYNNRAGVAILLLVIAVGVFWTRGFSFEFKRICDSPLVPTTTLLWSLSTVLLGCLAMYILAGRLGGFAESAYEIDRSWLTLQGKTPYVDFEWPFGAALLYGPVALHHLLSLDIVSAYYLFWSLNCLLGVCILYLLINAIDYPSSRKRSIFLLSCSAWFPSIINMGTHYTLVRYSLPLYFIVIVQKRIQRGEILLASTLVTTFTILLFLYSPEVAISFTLASGTLLVLSSHKRGMAFSFIFAGLLASIAAVFWAGAKLHVLDTVRASGGGADSFPVMLSLHILFFFFALFVCSCYAYQHFSGGTLKDNTIGLLIFALPMLAAAMGRCDSGHVYLNGLGVYIASLFYLSGTDRTWRWSKLAFIVVLIVVPCTQILWINAPTFARLGIGVVSSGDGGQLRHEVSKTGRALINKFAPLEKKQKWQEELEILLNGGVPQNVDLSAVYPSWKGKYLAPFGYKPNGFGTDLTSQIDYGRYEAMENANTPAAIADKVSEIRDTPTSALLLPDNYMSFCNVDVHEATRQIEVLFAIPFTRSPVHTESLRLPICSYIEANYRLVVAPTKQTFYYGLWAKK